MELHIPRAACIAGRREEDACWFRDGLIVVVSIQGVSQQPVITVFFLSSLIFINAAMIVFHCFFFLIRSFFLGAFLVIFTLLGVKTRDDYFFLVFFWIIFPLFLFFLREGQKRTLGRVEAMDGSLSISFRFFYFFLH